MVSSLNSTLGTNSPTLGLICDIISHNFHNNIALCLLSLWRLNMQKVKLVRVMMLCLLLFLSACNHKVEEEPVARVDASTGPTEFKAPLPKILEVRTDLKEKFGWHIVPRDVHSMTISVEAENVDTVLFWIAPTGTETWRERELIGYDIDGSDGWSITWDFGDRIFHDHISIQALGIDSSTFTDTTINVHSEDESDE